MNHFLDFKHYNLLMRAVDCSQKNMVTLYRCLFKDIMVECPTFHYKIRSSLTFW